MKEQFRRGRLKYVGFILLDIVCLLLANLAAVRLYLYIGDRPFGFSEYLIVVAYMIAIDVGVTVAFNTLSRVLRRRKRKEIAESIKHVGISMMVLTLLLFSMKKSADFSRVTVYLAYAIYFIFIVFAHIGCKEFAKLMRSRASSPTALLVTTSGYANEGLGTVENAGISVKGIFVTDKTNEGTVQNIPVIVDKQDASAFICWEWIDKVYICGPDSIDVPDSLIVACKQMGIPVYTAPVRKSLEYEIVKIRTAYVKEAPNTGLSFFEGEHDIPFQIRRLYTIYEMEQEKQRGFHAHKQSWHLLFCPYGSIDVMLDTGKERKTVSLSDPSTGLILHPSVWREMIWKKAGSVLCVAASGHYDADKLNVDYNDYIRFLQEKEWSATVESAEIIGEVVL